MENSFTKLNLSQELLNSIEKNNYKKATPIQIEVIPKVLAKEDILAQAQTGSGKTASFVLPILEDFLQTQKETTKPKITTLILAPTRDLTIQISKSFSSFSKHLSIKPKVVTIIGGADISSQLLGVQKGCDIVVATLGRLLDIIDKKQINLSHLKYFILDEADKMLDLGFLQEIDTILTTLPQNRQNLLFSATYPPKVLDIVQKITTKANLISIEQSQPIVQNITQRVIEVNNENKKALLQHLLKTNNWKKVLIFSSTKRSCDNLAFKFRKDGFNAESFHGDLEQDERNFTLKDFKTNEIDILFATDIASRGLHIDSISCVVNYTLPRSTDDYIHRIGRTARAGKDGIAITFVSLEDFEHFKLIEKRCKLDIQKEQIKGYELTGIPIAKQKGQPPIKGKRKSKKDKLRELKSQQKTDTITNQK